MSSLKCKASVAFLLLSAVFTPPSLYPAVVDAWVLGDGEKVFRYDTDHASRKSNSVRDGETVNLRGLYNEVLAFQVIAVADSEGAKAVEITVSASGAP